MRKKSLNIALCFLVPMLVGLLASPVEAASIAGEIIIQQKLQEVEDALKSGVKENIEVLKGLPEAGKRMNSAISDDYFLKLCQTGTPERVKAAINAGANVNAREKQYAGGSDYSTGWTPLMHAAKYNNNTEVVTLLISNGADVKARSDRGMTALELAAENISDLEVITTLIKNGADVNSNSAGPLWAAARYNSNPEIINALVKNGVYVKAKNDIGMTPLMVAARDNRNPAIITALIKNGVDVNAKLEENSRYRQANDGQKGWTALMFAAANTDNPEVITTLIKNGADIKEDGREALGYARESRVWTGNGINTRNREPEVVIALIAEMVKNGVDVNAKGNQGSTVLINEMDSSSWPNIEVITALIKNGADVNISDDYGRTPLIIAAKGQKEQPEIINLLLKNGADVKLEDNRGKTAINYAEDRRYYTTLKILEDHLK